MSFYVDCSTSTNYYNYNPISHAVPTTGAWKYFYFVCGGYKTTYNFDTFPSNTIIYLTVAAPGGLGVSSGGGGGGGNIVTYSVLSQKIRDINITLQPISNGGVNISILPPTTLTPTSEYPPIIYLKSGKNASGNAGGYGADEPLFLTGPSSIDGILKINTDGLGGDGNPMGEPYFSPTVSFYMPDKTTASVVSGGQLGQSGNSSWVMLYYKFNYENS
jgi:hypothetical protein